MSDSVEIFLAATANSPAPENIRRTLINGVSKARYQEHSSYNGDDPAPIWGVRDTMADRYGDQMETGDILLFYTGDNEHGTKEYAYLATIQDTEWNPELAKDIWVNADGEPGVEWPFIIFLANLREVHIPSAQMHDELGFAQSHLQSFRRVTEERIEPNLAGTTRRGYLMNLAQTNTPVSHDNPLPPTSSGGGQSQGSTSSPGVAPDRDERSADLARPDRVRTEISRVVRNTALVKQLKKEHDYECQVCGDVRQGPDGNPYAEGHHLHPLGDGGIDHEENIVVLCPNHHSDFDYGLVKIDPDSLEIDHQYESGHGSLQTVRGHDLGVSHLQYNNQEVADF